jgi:16S rRNA (guanine527-N7)-methyltransferase
VTPHPVELESRFTAVSRESWDRLDTYVALLLKWQERINLIAPSTVSEVWERHVADSLQLLPFVPSTTQQIADLGSGGGLPGIVLACATNANVHLYESNGRKCAFLQEALRQTGGKGNVHQVRVEALSGATYVPQVTIVTARAFAPLDTLLALAEPFLKRGATGVFHKGQKVEDELTRVAKSWRIQAVQHPSVIDSQSVILEVNEVSRRVKS